jgi:hypothetical protein
VLQFDPRINLLDGQKIPEYIREFFSCALERT